MWTGSEITFLRKNAGRGAAAIAAELGRSVVSVKSQAQRSRISLRRTGSRRGLVLGQARGVSIRACIRDDVLAGTVSGTLIAERMRVDSEGELCPSCVARPIAVSTSGLCRVCHCHALAEAHREALAEVEAQRALWQARQELKRARDQAAAEITASIAADA